jgi:hypothetical protein
MTRPIATRCGTSTPPTPPLSRRLLTDAAVIFGLAGVAVVQPLLDLFGDHPTFFVAGHYRTSQIVTFGVVIAVAPALAVFALSALPRLAGERAGAVAHGLGVGLLAGVFALVLCRTLGVDRFAVAGAIALATGIGVALAEHRWRPARQFLGFLALGNVVFLVLFLVASPTAELLRAAPANPAEPGVVPPLDGPVLAVVLDELPVTSLLRSDGTINGERYPHFARLAEGSTWFRDAASESSETYVSLPTILTGVRAAEDETPTYRDHPRNYFTLFGERYPVNAYSLFADLCPPPICELYRPATTRQMLDDALVVYGHRVLPERLREDLPRIDHSWGRFGEVIGVQAPTTVDGEVNLFGAMDQAPTHDAGSSEQVDAFRREIAKVGSGPSVNLVHVGLPHHPYVLTPWGAMLPDTWHFDDVPDGTTDPAHDPIARDLYALHALQIGAVDRMVGEMIDHLQEVGAWDDALVVVTSDHGVGITPPGLGREPGDADPDELYRIPLFLKAPGQADGEIRDDPASTVDVLPTIVDVLGIRTDWEFEGRSLFDGGPPEIERVVSSDVEVLGDVAARHTDRYPADDWEALAAVGEAADLVGAELDDQRGDPRLTLGEPSDLRWMPDHTDLLDDLSTTSGPVPHLLKGRVSGGEEKPPDLVVSLNGTLAGTISGYRPDGHSWRFTGVMAPYFRDGANEVVAYEVDRSEDEVVLHPVPEG